MTKKSIWKALREEAELIVREEPLLASYIHTCILKHKKLDMSLAYILANKLADSTMPAISLYELFLDTLSEDPSIVIQTSKDIEAVFNKDPAIHEYAIVLLYLKGFHAIQVHRIAHRLWQTNRKRLALFIQSRNSVINGVDIHPAAQIGEGVMFDHATGIVVGETAVIESNVSILQNVTLGGTGKASGDRHPKVRQGVMIGSGAKVLGNIEIGTGAQVGAGSVVLKNVSPHTTVVGVPAVKIGVPKNSCPSDYMDQNILDGNDISQLFIYGAGI